MIYRYFFSVMLWRGAVALSTQGTAYASFTRIVPAIIGAGTAGFASALWDYVTGWRGMDAPHPFAATRKEQAS
jgi:hypothetical protein